MRHSGQDVSRETFIALRARREAYRIATDVLYEKAEEPPPPPPKPLHYGVSTERRPIPGWIRGGAILLLGMMAFFAIVWFCMAVGLGTLRLPGR